MEKVEVKHIKFSWNFLIWLSINLFSRGIMHESEAFVSGDQAAT